MSVNVAVQRRAGSGAAAGAVSEPDADGMLPLHCAAMRGTNVDVVRVLLAAQPGAAAVQDGAGRLPLNCAAIIGASEAVMAELQAAHPLAAEGLPEIFAKLQME